VAVCRLFEEAKWTVDSASRARRQDGRQTDGDGLPGHRRFAHGGPVDRTGETIDHVAFRLDDHEAMRLKLDRLSIPYSRMDLPELGERRLFIRTPTGILLELVFRDENAESVTSRDQEQNHAQ
jgi:hypothetical protein